MELMAKAPIILREYLGYMETIRGKSSKTVEEYYIDLRTFFRYLKLSRGLIDKKIDFKDINIDDINLDIISSVTLTEVYDI